MQKNNVYSVFFIFTFFLGWPSIVFSQTPEWTFEVEGNSRLYSSNPAVGIDGTVYMAADNGKLIAINPDGSKKWIFDIGGTNFGWKSPFVDSKGNIYISALDHNLYAINSDGSLKWLFPLGSASFSSPAVTENGTVYIGSSSSSTSPGKLYAINSDGFLEWELEVGQTRINTQPSISSNGTIYITTHNNKLLAVDSSGTLIWSINIMPSDNFDGITSPDGLTSPIVGLDDTIYIGAWDKKLHAIGSNGLEKWAFESGAGIWHVGYDSPTVDSNGTIYIGSHDGKMYALNSNGTEKWSFQTESSIRTKATLDTNDYVFFTSEDGYLYSVNPHGVEAWSWLSESKYYHLSSPVFYNDTIYIIESIPYYDNSTKYTRRLSAVKIDNRIKWSFKIESNIGHPAISDDGTVFVGADNRKLYSISPNGLLNWSFEQAQGSIVGAPAIWMDGTIYFGSSDHKLYALNPNGTFRWSLDTGSFILSSPTLGADGTIYVGSSDSFFYAVNPNGSIKWRYKTDHQIQSTASIDGNGTLYIGSLDRRLYAIHDRITSGHLKWSFPTGNYVDSSVLGHDGTIYLGSRDNRLYALDSMGSLKWELESLANKSNLAIGPDGTIYFTTITNEGFRENPNDLWAVGPTGTVKWTFNGMGAAVGTSPVIDSNGTIYFSAGDLATTGGEDFGKLYAVTSLGNLKWEFGVKHIFRSSPAIAPDGTIYLASLDGRLYAVNGDSDESGSWPGFQNDVRHTGRDTRLSPIISGSNLTNTLPPTWTWVAQTDTDLFRYTINSDDLTQNATMTQETTFISHEILADGVYVLSVQECHAPVNNTCPEENWSLPGSFGTWIDTKLPLTTAVFSTTDSISKVALGCEDGDGSGCSETFYSIDGGANYLPYEGAISILSQTQLRFYSVDRAGNSESPNELIGETFTALDFSVSQVNVAFNGSVDIAGRLNQPTNTEAIDLSGLTIHLLVTFQDKSQYTLEVTTNSLGRFNLDDIGGFNPEGRYTLQAKFIGTSLLAPSASVVRPVLVGTSAGYAVIVQGKIPSEEGLLSHNKSTNRMYNTLIERGFDPENILYFNYNTSQEGVDEVPNKTTIASIVQNWAADNMNAVPAPFYLIMADHGGPNGEFYLDTEVITPMDIATWLEVLESKLVAPASRQKRVVIIGACYSGSFITGDLSGPGRILITSSASSEVSYKGALEEDDIRVGEFFLEEFFHSLEDGSTLRNAFTEATEKTEIFTRSEASSINNTDIRYLDSAVQHPLLDDNGDGVGSNILSNNTDGDIAAELKLGIDVDVITNSALQVDIIGVSDPIYLDSDQTSATVKAQVNFNWRTQVVWVEVRQPQWKLEQPSEIVTLQSDNILPRHFLRSSDELLAVAAQFEKNLNVFQLPGIYEIYFFAQDNETGKVSSLKRSLVYKDRLGNDPPSAFDLKAPADKSLISLPQIFRWQAATDPNGEMLSYSLLISDSVDFNNIVFRKDELTSPHAAIGANSSLQTDLDYYWKVEAVDAYGSVTVSNQIYQFRIGDVNANEVILSGRILSNANQLNLTGVKVISVSMDSEAAVILGYNLAKDGMGRTEYLLRASGEFGKVEVIAIGDNHGPGNASSNWESDRVTIVYEIPGLDIILPYTPNPDQILENNFESEE